MKRFIVLFAILSISFTIFAQQYTIIRGHTRISHTTLSTKEQYIFSSIVIDNYNNIIAINDDGDPILFNIVSSYTEIQGNFKIITGRVIEVEQGGFFAFSIQYSLYSNDVIVTIATNTKGISYIGKII